MSTLSTTHEAIARRAFGRSVALEEVETYGQVGLDAAWETRTVDGRELRDLALVSGGDNLAQALRVNLLTPLGSDLLNVRFGFDGLRALSQPFDHLMLEDVLRLAVIRTVGGDRRIKRILDVALELPEDEKKRAEFVQHRRWTVRVDARTVLGDAIRLALGEVNASG
jgi:hypothetical protein